MSDRVLSLGVDGRELARGTRTGIGRYLVEVLLAAARAGHTCVVYGDEATDVERIPLAPGLRFVRIPGRWTQWWDQVRLPRALRRDGIRVFLSPYYKAPLVTPCPVVLTIHDLFFIGYPGRPRPIRDWLMTVLARLYASRAAAIVADSEHSRAAVLARVRIDPARVHAIGVAVGAEFRPVPRPAAVARRYGVELPYVLYVGNFMPHKNVERLVDAYAALPAALRDSHALVLAGSDRANRPALERAVAHGPLGRRVVFTGRVEDTDLPGLYAGARLFVLPSLEEGFGVPAVEAMACGVPVVVSDRGALPEIVADAGLIVPAESTAALTAAIGRLLTEPELASHLRARGLERARDFAGERTAARVVALLAHVATDSAVAAPLTGGGR